MNVRAWLNQMWPLNKRHIAQCYVNVGLQYPAFLADLALRGSVYSAIRSTDPIELGRLLGRRELALETIKLCHMDPDALRRLCDPLPEPEKKAA